MPHFISVMNDVDDARRERLRQAVAWLGRSMATGGGDVAACELEALAAICAEQGLLSEAVRVQRWAAAA